MESIDKTLKYYELLMTLDGINNMDLNIKLPEGFDIVFLQWK